MYRIESAHTTCVPVPCAVHRMFVCFLGDEMFMECSFQGSKHHYCFFFFRSAVEPIFFSGGISPAPQLPHAKISNVVISQFAHSPAPYICRRGIPFPSFRSDWPHRALCFSLVIFWFIYST